MLNSFSSKFEAILNARISEQMNSRVDSLVNNTELEHRQSDHLRGFISALKWVSGVAIPETAKKVSEE